jgi:hypothetical protein
MLKRNNFYPNGEVIDYSLPQSFRKSLTKEACGNCGLYSNQYDHFVVGGVQSLYEIIIYAQSGDNDFSKDK